MGEDLDRVRHDLAVGHGNRGEVAAGVLLEGELEAEEDALQLLRRRQDLQLLERGCVHAFGPGVFLRVGGNTSWANVLT